MKAEEEAKKIEESEEEGKEEGTVEVTQAPVDPYDAFSDKRKKEIHKLNKLKSVLVFSGRAHLSFNADFYRKDLLAKKNKPRSYCSCKCFCLLLVVFWICSGVLMKMYAPEKMEAWMARARMSKEE